MDKFWTSSLLECAGLPTPETVVTESPEEAMAAYRDLVYGTEGFTDTLEIRRLWREHLFAWMTRNATRATDFFNIPANRVVELGTHIEI